ncbi:hypothetical protein OROMI_006794 [Orobanche minor]
MASNGDYCKKYQKLFLANERERVLVDYLGQCFYWLHFTSSTFGGSIALVKSKVCMFPIIPLITVMDDPKE